MSIQKTPPLGWPHTEAENHKDSLVALPAHEVVPAPRRPKRSSKRRFGCCLGLTLFLLFIVGAVVLVVYVSARSAAEQTEFDTASSAFLSTHVDWYVESVDRPDENSDSVRLVAWNDSLYVGRLVYMVPDGAASDGWIEFPLIEELEGDQLAEDTFLRAFSATFSDVAWSYVRDVQSVDLVAEPQVWRASYRVLEQNSEEWTEVREAYVERDPQSGEWAVYPQSTP